jgi:Flp pilus assembly protein CpaB
MARPTRSLLLVRAHFWARRHRVVPIISLVALASGSGAYVRATVAHTEELAAAWGSTVAVVVATRDLVPGTLVAEADLAEAVRPIVMVPGGSLSSPQEATGRVVTATVLAGEAVPDRRLAPTGAGGPGALVTADRRAVTLPAGEAAVPAAAGDRLDLVAVVDGTTVATDAVVVATGPDGELTVAVRRGELAAVAVAQRDGELLAALHGSP